MMYKPFIKIVFIALLAMNLIAVAETYYVRLDGSNNNSGTENSSGGAWKTLSYAFSKLEGGDHLYIADGLYETNELILKNVHGTEENPTVISAINPLGAVITLQGTPEWGNTISIQSCSYVIVEDLEVYQSAPTKGTGIETSKKSHHITVRNNYVHDCGCNGISARGSDYVTVEKNIVHDNAKRSEWNCSGISYFLPTVYDQERGFHHIIRQNIVFNNECRLPFKPGGFDTPTDGNGIILDLFNNKYDDNEGEPGGYTQATLIENNLSFNNGGRGIHIFQSDNVTVRNNTTWHNLHVLSEYDKWKGDMESFESRDLSIYNNLIVQNDAPDIGCYETDAGTGIEQRNVQNTPGSFELLQAYPNPFNPTTTITFSCQNHVHVKARVFNVNGQLITTLVDEEKSPGQHTPMFDAHNLESGIYLLKVRAGGFEGIVKMTLVK